MHLHAQFKQEVRVVDLRKYYCTVLESSRIQLYAWCQQLVQPHTDLPELYSHVFPESSCGNSDHGSTELGYITGCITETGCSCLREFTPVPLSVYYCFYFSSINSVGLPALSWALQAHTGAGAWLHMTVDSESG